MALLIQTWARRGFCLKIVPLRQGGRGTSLIASDVPD
jgi:hypothetical protein